jgi:hypothetical protein
MTEVCRLIGLANTHGVATLSMDDDVPEEMLETASGWFSTAIMAWRE